VAHIVKTNVRQFPLDAFLSEKKAAKTRTSRFAALIPDELAS
jgi:hypothetical protein